MPFLTPGRQVTEYRITVADFLALVAAQATIDLGETVTAAEVESIEPDEDDASFFRLTLKKKDKS